MEGIKYKKGITLIEVILSLAILSIIIGPILSLTLSTVKINKQSDDKLKAVNIAQKHLEEIKSSDYTLQPNLIFEIKETRTENNFEIERTITPIEAYKIEDNPDDTGITYDAEIKNNITTNNNIPVDLLIDHTSTEKIKINLIESASTEVNLKIKLTESTKVEIELNNNSSRVLNVYFSEDSLNYSITKCNGKVKIFTNVLGDIQLSNNKYRLYKIVIEVKKNNKLLQKIEGYKTCLK